MPSFFIDVKERGAKKAEKNIKGLNGALGGLAKRAGLTAAAFVGYQKITEQIGKSITLAANLQGVQRGFDNLAKSSGFSTSAFQNFKNATDGTIDSITLMTKANNAMLLGITDSEDQMAEMFDVAQRLGKSLGIDTVQSIDSLVTGLGRQSKLMLDNLGIMVDTEKANKDYAASLGITSSQLTDQQRKTAFVNAAMAEANSLVSKLGEEQLDTKDKIAQLSTATTDLSASFGEFLEPAVNLGTTALINLSKSLTSVLNTVNSINDQPLVLATDEEINTDQISDFRKEIEGLTFVELADLAKSLNNDVGFFNTLGNESELAAEKIKIINEAMESSETPMIKINEVRKTGLGLLQKQKVVSASFAQEEAIRIKSLSDLEVKAVGTTLGALGKLNTASKGSAKLSARLAQAQAIADTYAGANKAFAQGGFLGFATAAAIIASGLANVVNISQQLGEIQSFATGGDFITSGEQLIRVGDNPSGRERVQITPLGGDPAPNAPSGGSVTVNVSGNVMSQDYVEGELAEQIKEAIRRGNDFGVS
jgi:hypothetical protein